MRFLLMGVLLMPMTLPAQTPKAATAPKATKAKNSKKTKTAPKREEAKPPAGAVQTSPGTWRYTDTDGKNWVYRETPFGLMRAAEVSPEQTAATIDAQAAGMRAFDEGDTVRFERQGPMGLSRWQKKKGEMTEAERKAWERDTQPKPVPQTESKPEPAPKQE